MTSWAIDATQGASEDDPLLRSWFIFGENPDSGLVDIADPEGDVIIRATREQADAIIEARDAFLRRVLQILATRSTT